MARTRGVRHTPLAIRTPILPVSSRGMNHLKLTGQIGGILGCFTEMAADLNAYIGGSRDATQTKPARGP